jgi:sec-independent protein translocase protein TatA
MMTEVAFLMFLALIVFGPRKALEMGQTLGRTIAKFKQAASQLQSELQDEVRTHDPESAPHPKP